MATLPPEVFSAIASYVTPLDLVTLSRTSKAFQRAAEPRIYDVVLLRDAQSTYLGCHAIMARDAFRAPYVTRLVLWQDPRRALPRNNLASVPPQFWLAVQHALTKTVNLEHLVLHDPIIAHSWVLDHDDIKFQLHEANFRLPWDSHMVAFLQNQHKLQILSTSDSLDDGPPCNLPPTALQALRVYTGPVLVVAELIQCPLAHVEILVDQETAPILSTVIADFGKMMTSLRSLNIVGIPDQLLLETLQLVSTSIFVLKLRYLGVLPLPTREWHAIQRCLMKLPALEVIELNVSRWDPQPHEFFQRSILLDFRIFCPALQQVVFWLAQYRFHWYMREGEWVCTHQTGRVPGSDALWRS